MNRLDIRIKGVKKSYNDNCVLSNIDLNINNDTFYAIVGKSGAGKSTFMNILGLIEEFDDGEYIFNGEKIEKNIDYNYLRLNNIGFIFQSYNLIPTLTPRENIMLPLLYKRGRSSNIDRLCKELDIQSLLDKDVKVLSGGEKQRVAIARALVMNPSLIIADEPTGNLDEENRQIVFELLRKEHKKGRAIVMITHDNDAAGQADNILILSNGELHKKMLTNIGSVGIISKV